MTEQNQEEILKGIFAATLGISVSEISDSTSPESTPTWDSFNALMLVSELEKKFKVQFTADEMSSIHNVRDIKAFLRQKGISI